MLDKVDALFARLEDVMAFQAIRQGLILTIPVLLVGSFCLIFLNLPLAPYQDALAGAPRVEGLLDLVYDGTMGIFSLYVSVAVALRYANACAERFGGFFVQGAPFAALAAYLMSVGFGTEGFDPIVLSTRSLFIAIVCGLASSVLYCRLVRLRRTRRLYGDSLDNVFNQAVSGLLPIEAVIALFGAANAAVAALSGSSCIEQLFFDSVSALFPLATATLGSGLLYLFLNNVMWFFGIHGGNMLDGVAQSVFVPGTAANAAALAAGGEPVQIVTKTFLDVFASIGGAGALLSLLAAILLFGRRRSARRLSAFAAVPMCFNISEIMLFGLPVVWNPALFVPFIAVPLVNMVVSYAAMAAGLVPPVVVDVSWTTPPLVGGWVATGSPAGAVLQLACIVLGTVLYLPFLRRYERLADAHARVQYDALLSSFQDDERAVGAEALLRMEHPVYGWLYPPLVIELAREAGAGGELERAVFERALADAQAAEALAHAGELDAGFSVSVNATATMLQDEAAVGFVIDAFRARGLDAGRVVVEATEREALLWDAGAHDLLRRVADAGMPLAIDDFSMGRTSFQYLETSVFSVVKLDGTIAKGVMENERYAEIVSSIADLSEHLGFTVLAEYVETAEQRDVLKTLGCSYFQGYLYAPALPFDEMVERARLTGTLR